MFRMLIGQIINFQEDFLLVPELKQSVGSPRNTSAKKQLAVTPPPEVPAKRQQKETCKICGISMEQKNKLLKHIRDCHDVTISVKKIDDKGRKGKLKIKV